jgi:hypothetical protein
LAATHLSALSSFDDASFAKTVAQVLSVEQQQAVALGRAGGAPVDTLTPAVASTDGALEAGQPVEQPAPADADADDTDDSDDTEN